MEVIVCVGTIVIIVGEDVTVGASGVAESATVAVGRLASWVDTAATIAAGELMAGYFRLHDAAAEESGYK